MGGVSRGAVLAPLPTQDITESGKLLRGFKKGEESRSHNELPKAHGENIGFLEQNSGEENAFLGSGRGLRTPFGQGGGWEGWFRPPSLPPV